jgi:hypothetical protein
LMEERVVVLGVGGPGPAFLRPGIAPGVQHAWRELNPNKDATFVGQTACYRRDVRQRMGRL